MKQHLIPVIGLLCLVGCKDNAEISDLDSFGQSRNSVSKISNLDCIQRHIGLNTQTRSVDQVNIEPYIYEGDTVMYVVNYKDGWELLSNDTSVPMVVAHADEGEFVKDSLPKNMAAYFDNVAKNLYDRYADGVANSDVCGEWSQYCVPGSIIGPVSPRDTIIIDARDTLLNDYIIDVSYETVVGSGGWVPIDTIGFTVTNINECSLNIETEWGVRNPWNMYAPMNVKGHYDSNHTAVIVGQYLTFLRRNFNAEIMVADSLNYDSSTGEFVPIHYSTTILDHVANTVQDSYVEVQNAAIVIRGITYDMNTIYNNEKPITDLNKTRSYLTRLGFTCIGKSITYDNLSNKIDIGVPQLLPILNNAVDATDNDLYGLAMVIAVRKNHVRSDIRYGWLGFDRNGNSTIVYDNGHYYFKYQCYHSIDYVVDEMRARWIDDSVYDNIWVTIDSGFQQNVSTNDYQGSFVWDMSLTPYF